jgi:RHS repeat-associated protein
LGRQKTVTDLRGGVTETEYTPGGRVDWVDDPLDRRTDYIYDDAGRLWKTTVPGSLTTVYGYDADSRVNVVTSPEGNEVATTYDGLGRVLTVTDPAGVVTTNTWTKTGQIKTTAKSGEGAVTFDYYPDGDLEWVEDALGNRTAFSYDDRGRLETRTDAELNEWLTDYNPAGELISETDPLDRTTAYTYDDAGRMETKSDPSGRTSTWVWQADGRLDTRTDVLGAVETTTIDYDYDAVGRRSAAAVSGTSPWPLGETTKLYTYNAAGDLTSESLVSVMDLSVRTQSYDYDIAGRRTRLRRADGTTVDYAYDVAGRVDTLTAGEVTADSFAGLTTGPFDYSKWTTTTTGDATAMIEHSAGALAVTSMSTSAVDTMSLTPAAADGDSTVTYAFASDTTPTEFRLDERITTSGDRYSLQLVANSTTAAITKTVSGATTTLATFSVPVGTDPQRARLEVHGSTVSAKVWDPDTAEPDTWSATATDLSITADGVPGLHAATGAGTTNTVTVDDWTHHDPSNSPVTLVDYGWDDDSKLTSEVFADGGTRDWTWTDARLTGLDQDIPGAVHTSSLGYDSAGRINAETVDAATTTYGYDDAGQLLSTDPASGPTSTWTYDTLGHRSTQSIGSDTITYSYDDAGQLTTATPDSGPQTAYTYDQAGRRLTETTGSDVTTSTYNASGQLTQSELPSGELIWRTTDADGASVGFFTDNSSTIRYQFYDWDTTSGLSELTAIAGIGYGPTGLYSKTIDLTRASGTPWASAHTTASIDALAADIHGSTIDSTATNLAASPTYTPWGQADTTTAHPKLGYHGELTIGGLTHLRARDYDPTTSTFTTTDPLNGVNGTTVLNNPYHYTNNTPLNMVDPDGMRPFDLLFAMFGFEGPAAPVAQGTTALISLMVMAGLEAAVIIGAVTAGAVALLGFLYLAENMCCGGSRNHGTPYPHGFEQTTEGRSVPPDTLTLLAEGNRRNPTVTAPRTGADENDGAGALIDSSAVYRYRTVVPMLEAQGEQGVISDRVELELQNNASSKGLPYPAHPFPIVPDVANSVVMARMRQQYSLQAGPGIEGDIIIGTTAITLGRRLYTSDRFLLNAVINAGGSAKWVPG